MYGTQIIAEDATKHKQIHETDCFGPGALSSSRDDGLLRDDFILLPASSRFD